MKMEDMNYRKIDEESIIRTISKSVPGYLPQEVYEKGEFFVGEKVILFDKRQEE